MKFGRHLLLILSLAVVLCSPGGPVIRGQAKKTARDGANFREQDMLNAIKKLEEEIRLAVLKGDVTWWTVNVSDEYSETEPDGKVLTKAQAIEMQRSKTLVYDTMNFSDRSVRTFNSDTVIVTGKMTVEGTNQGQNFNGEFQFTRVWVKQGLEWKLASFQMTRTTPAAQPTP